MVAREVSNSVKSVMDSVWGAVWNSVSRLVWCSVRDLVNEPVSKSNERFIYLATYETYDMVKERSLEDENKQ